MAYAALDILQYGVDLLRALRHAVHPVAILHEDVLVVHGDRAARPRTQHSRAVAQRQIRPAIILSTSFPSTSNSTFTRWPARSVLKVVCSKV